MDITYFNHRSYTAQSWWERQSFLHKWWRIYGGDPYWAPPYYPLLRRALAPAGSEYLVRAAPLPVYTEAPFRRKGSSSLHGGYVNPALLDQPVAATVALCDPRRRDRMVYLALLACANDSGSLERLLEYLAEALRARGYRRAIGPTGLSPHLGSGLLQDYWSDLPPLHTPYNPPYLPEVIGSVLQPGRRSRLYHLEISPELPPLAPLPAQLVPLEPARLAADLLPLLVVACSAWGDFAPPDAPEAVFLLHWLGQWPLFGWLAQVEAQPVGFVLLQPDLAPRLRRAKGGRDLLWRLWLAWAGRQPARHGRVIFAAVLPSWQGQGIGRQLLHQALHFARQQGWLSLSIGPLPDSTPAGKFLKDHGAQPRQSYLLYQGDL